MAGSGVGGKSKGVRPSLLRSKGLPKEVKDVRDDMKKALASLACITVEEFVDPATAAAAGLKAATATVTTASTLLLADLLSAGLLVLAAYARNLTFTTAGTTPADAPATVTVNGLDANGLPQSETITLAQTAAAATGVKAFSKVTSIVYPAGDGTGATIAIGYGNLLGLKETPKSRAGLVSPILEIAVGAKVTTGVLDAVNRTYAPAAAPDGVKDYCVYFESVPRGLQPPEGA